MTKKKHDNFWVYVFGVLLLFSLFLLIIGYTPIEIVVYLCSNNVLETFKPNHITEIFTGEGVYNYSFIYEHCEKLTLAKINYIPTLKQIKDNFNKHLIIFF